MDHELDPSIHITQSQNERGSPFSKTSVASSVILDPKDPILITIIIRIIIQSLLNKFKSNELMGFVREIRI